MNQSWSLMIMKIRRKNSTTRFANWAETSMKANMTQRTMHKNQPPKSKERRSPNCKPSEVIVISSDKKLQEEGVEQQEVVFERRTVVREEEKQSLGGTMVVWKRRRTKTKKTKEAALLADDHIDDHCVDVEHVLYRNVRRTGNLHDCFCRTKEVW